MKGLLWFYRTLVKLALGRGVIKSYSQFGEDAIVHSLLRSVRKGVYVDVGCADPVLYSNTYRFYKKGWKGLCIDPNPDFADKYALMRRRDTFVNIGIGAEGALNYHRFSDETYNTFSAEEAAGYVYKNTVQPLSIEMIPLEPLASVVKRSGIGHIDYLNIDAQGFDLEVLASHDWEIPPTVISVEDERFDASNPTASDIHQYLIGKGYELRGLSGLTLIFKRL